MCSRVNSTPVAARAAARPRSQPHARAPAGTPAHLRARRSFARTPVRQKPVYEPDAGLRARRPSAHARALQRSARVLAHDWNSTLL
ncbi:hypothetical protein CDL15_Pgr012433 [Punica granatum]|uniref:Uncharacterized protein n=1 Tax=Punica granatum TaxID=22663 RepID=A0A218WZR6_PUNGR|nr:hypothetical protein CDL15_Pgr012433 [Punica granatum]